MRDYGEGIPREHIPRLTERFYRVDTARSRSLGGTGLGLAIVKHIANRHRGALTIDSVEGQGATFTIWLPIAPERRFAPIATVCRCAPGVVQANDHRVTGGLLRINRWTVMGKYGGWGLVFVLALCNALSFIDRQLINLLIEPIRHDLALTDTQLGLLQGTVFAFTYAALAIPCGMLTDRTVRTWVVGAGLLVWSGMTMVAGFARSFGMLGLSRLGIATRRSDFASGELFHDC